MAEFLSKKDAKGYHIILEVNQLNSTRVRARLFLKAEGWWFQEWLCSGSMTINGQRFSYSGRPYLPTRHTRVILLDREITISSSSTSILVSAELTTPTSASAYYLPNTGRFSIANQTYNLPLWQRNPTVTNTNITGSLSFNLPADSTGSIASLNDYLWWRQIFWCGDFNQCGGIRIHFTGDNDEFLYGVETMKRKAGSETEFNFLVSNGKGGYEVKKRWTFSPTHQDKDNPFNPERGFSDLLRRDDEVQVSWFGSYPKFDCPNIKGKRSLKVHLTFYHIGSNPKVHHMYIDAIKFRKDFVEGWEDVPNRFGRGSVVVIDSENDRVLVDNMEKNKEIVQGSDFVTIPPGDSVLEVYRSSWAKQAPEITVSFEERYL